MLSMPTSHCFVEQRKALPGSTCKVTSKRRIRQGGCVPLVVQQGRATKAKKVVCRISCYGSGVFLFGNSPELEHSRHSCSRSRRMILYLLVPTGLNLQCRTPCPFWITGLTTCTLCFRILRLMNPSAGYKRFARSNRRNSELLSATISHSLPRRVAADRIHGLENLHETNRPHGPTEPAPNRRSISTCLSSLLSAGA